MGSFSWTRAESTTIRANFTEGDSYKLLVPKEFGGGYISDTYFDYGYVFYGEDSNGEYVDGEGNVYKASEFGENDIYGILAYLNNCEELEYEPEVTYPKTMYEILKYGNTLRQDNRCIGIEIGCYDSEMDKLKFPLKLVSASYKGTYEDCKGKSYSDPNQGFGEYYWDNEDYTEYYDKLKSLR